MHFILPLLLLGLFKIFRDFLCPALQGSGEGTLIGQNGQWDYYGMAMAARHLAPGFSVGLWTILLHGKRHHKAVDPYSSFIFCIMAKIQPCPECGHPHLKRIGVRGIKQCAACKTYVDVRKGNWWQKLLSA
jgi:ribosomal protein L37AE/L43A